MKQEHTPTTEWPNPHPFQDGYLTALRTFRQILQRKTKSLWTGFHLSALTHRSILRSTPRRRGKNSESVGKVQPTAAPSRLWTGAPGHLATVLFFSRFYLPEQETVIRLKLVHIACHSFSHLSRTQFRNKALNCGFSSMSSSHQKWEINICESVL